MLTTLAVNLPTCRRCAKGTACPRTGRDIAWQAEAGECPRGLLAANLDAMPPERLRQLESGGPCCDPPPKNA